jgi:uncharacterized membrane protein
MLRQMATAGHHGHGAFGEDAFGRAAEKTARFFGTPQYIIGQTIVVVLWVLLNAAAFIGHWDPYPFHPLEFGVLASGCLCGAAYLARANATS